jgi:tetratricopeptide (TPR) repeat protein
MARVLFPSNDSRTAGALNNISVTMQGLGRRKEAGEALSESLAMYRAIHAGDHPDIARAMGHSAVWNAVDGRYLEAEAFARDSLAMYQRLFAGPRRDPVAHAKLTLARVVAASGRMEEAEPLFKDAVAEQRLVAKDKDDPDTARVLHIYGHALLTGGRADEAAVPLREAVEIGTRLWPNAGLPRPHLAEWAETLADALSATGRSQEADEVRGLFAQPSSR